MSQLDALRRFVGSKIRIRGQEYFDRKAVSITFADADFVSAKVAGSLEYEVDLERDGKTLVYSCDCPFFEDNRELCKHVWATLLKLESTGHLRQWAASFPTRLVPTDADADIDDDFDDLDLDDGEDFFGSYQRPAGSKSHSKEPVAPDSWQLLINRITSREEPAGTLPPWPPGREIVYVLEYGRTAYGPSLAIRVDTRDPKKSGDWKKPKPLTHPQNLIAAIPDPADREILSRFVGVNREKWYYRPNESTYRFQPMRHELLALLPLISQTGRFFFSTPESSESRTIRWDNSSPWEFCVEAHPDEQSQRYEIRGSFRRTGQRIPIEQAEYIFEEGILISGDSVAPYEGAFRWISLFRREGSFFVPHGEADQWIEKMLQVPSGPRLELPEELRLQEIEMVPKAVARISPSHEAWDPHSFDGFVLFEYAGEIVAGNAPGSGILRIAERQKILRNQDFEARARQRFEKAGFRRKFSMRGAGGWTILQSRLPAAVRDLVAEGWQVEAEGKLFRNPNSLNFHLSSGIDWFELHGSVEFGETRITIPKLLAALKRRESTVLLDDGSYGMLPEEWLEKYGLLAGLGTAEGDHVRFSRNQAGLLDALLASQPEVSCDALFERARNELKNFGGVAAADPPSGFQGSLRPYQRGGLGWLHFLQRFGFGGCLADDMGLGKTIQVLALLEERRAARGLSRAADKQPPSLVIMPRSLVFNWIQEARRFTPTLRILEHTGGVRIRGHKHFDDYDVVFTTYGTLRRDASFFKDKLFDYVILDEAQAIKNSSTESAKATRLLSSHHRLALSGTPIENHLGELWSLFEFLNPGMLGSASLFKLGRGTGGKLDEEQRSMLAQALRPFILRRTKSQVARDLPEKVEQTLFCQLEPPQRALYDELRDHYRDTLLNRIERDGLDKSRMQILEALLRLRQAAIHPGLIDRSRSHEPSAKLDMLLPQLAEVLDEGHKALVFSQFTSMLQILRNRLDQQNIGYEYLDGQTRDRAAPVERFQNNPESRLFLISLKAGGLGLNLTAAEYVFLLDPWWNPAVEAQAIDRTHRIGQTRSVFAYRLIAKDTVEEKVLELQESKREIAEAIINQDNSILRGLRAEDLAILLS
jgi:superfamily II DNA or RNA helicase